MSLKWYEINEAIEDAKETTRVVDVKVNQMAGIISGKLKICDVDSDILCKLKSELKNFNMHTFKWKD